MAPRTRRRVRFGSSALVPASGDVVPILAQVTQLREAMNETPPCAHDNATGTESGSRSGIDVSNDLEKDINIDAPINNNNACSITHHSNITITYYNFEHADDEAHLSRGGMRPYIVWLPAPYVTALDQLRVAAGKDRNELASMAYSPILERFGIKIAESQRARQKGPDE